MPVIEQFFILVAVVIVVLPLSFFMDWMWP